MTLKSACFAMVVCFASVLSAQTITGSGAKGYIAKFNSATNIVSSRIFQNGTGVGVNTITPGATLDVNGNVNSTTGYYLGGKPFAFGSGANALFGFAGNTTMTGTYNTATGNLALFSNTTGQTNVAGGAYALYSNTTGQANTASGYQTMYANTTGGYNTATGVFALQSNTTGGGNTAEGSEALQNNTTGFNNTAEGNVALVGNTTGYMNTGIGNGALYYNSTGAYNTAVGGSSLFYNSTGSSNTAIGYSAGPDNNSTNLTNTTAIGYNATVSENNALVLGGSGVYAVRVGIGTATPTNVFTIVQNGGAAIADGWTTYSSLRWKTNIQTLHGALAKVEQLRGVSYDLKGSNKHELGVVAEEVGAVVPEVVTWEENGKDARGVDYSRLTVLLIEATKEQQALIREQQQEISVQRKRIDDLTRQVQTVLTDRQSTH